MVIDMVEIRSVSSAGYWYDNEHVEVRIDGKRLGGWQRSMETECGKAYNTNHWPEHMVGMILKALGIEYKVLNVSDPPFEPDDLDEPYRIQKYSRGVEK
jgi:hypothetical protein